MMLLDKAARCIIPPPNESINDELARLKKIRAGLLPVEAHSNRNLDERIRKLESLAIEPVSNLQRLSPEIFSMKKGRFPAFAVFAINGDGNCTIASDSSHFHMPNCCKPHYYWTEQVLDRFNRHRATVSASLSALCAAIILLLGWHGMTVLSLALTILFSTVLITTATWKIFAVRRRKEIENAYFRRGRKRVYSATAQFSGIIPDATKAKLKEYEPLFDEIFLVVEVDKWATNEPISVPVGDPLMVGSRSNAFYRIDKFDTTSLEDYVASEFCEKQ